MSLLIYMYIHLYEQDMIKICLNENLAEGEVSIEWIQ